MLRLPAPTSANLVSHAISTHTVVRELATMTSRHSSVLKLEATIASLTQMTLSHVTHPALCLDTDIPKWSSGLVPVEIPPLITQQHRFAWGGTTRTVLLAVQILSTLSLTATTSRKLVLANELLDDCVTRRDWTGIEKWTGDDFLKTAVIF